MTALGTDLTQCDREPIHIPGSIQPHGILIAAHARDLSVMVVSANIAEASGVELDAILGRPLAKVVGDATAARIRELVDARTWTENNPLAVTAFGRRFDGVLHAHDDAVILELEPSKGEGDASIAPALRGVLHALQQVDSIDALCKEVAHQVRALTGFERAMLYRFDEDGHGKVEAEDVLDTLEPYLGLHYPASDIPRQARELYLKNWLRIICDARYTPVPLTPAVRPDTGGPLDLSFSVLRSVSPVHLEYLANMGVRASMSISLVVHDRLWGLISCVHHSGPHAVSYATRSACEVIGRLASLEIAALEERELARLRVERAGARASFGQIMRETDEDGDVLESLVANADALLSHVHATGAAVITQYDTLVTCGRCPPEPRIRAITDWLGTRGAEAPFATDSIARELPEASEVAGTACGVLTFAIPGSPQRRVLWFRPELVHTVEWGGDPRKAVELDPAARLHPRRSFALWKEEVRLRSKRWSAADIEAADELRQMIVGIALERQFARAMRAIRVRDDMVAVVSHDLRSPLSVIQMAANLLQTMRPPIDMDKHVLPNAMRIERAVDYMNAMIADLLDLAKMQAGGLVLQVERHDLRGLVEDAVNMMLPLAEAKRVVLRHTAQASIPLHIDRDRIFQMLTNLIGNAIKFTPEAGSVVVELTENPENVTVTVTDTGQGIPEADLPHVFDRYWQSRKSSRGSAGLGLFIAKGVVEAHAGRIWVESEVNRGSRFSVCLPRR